MAALSDETLLAISRLSVGTPITDASDFTAMTPAQVAAKYELASYGGDEGSYVYAPGADGDYDALDPDLPPVNDLGLWAVGAFTNYLVNGMLTGAVAGSPGTMPTNWSTAVLTRTGIDLGTYKGLPLLTIDGTTASAGYDNNQQYALAAGDIVNASGYYGFSGEHETAAIVRLARENWNPKVTIDCTSSQTIARRAGQYTVGAGETGGLTLAYMTVSEESAIQFQIAGRQVVKNIGSHPPVLALSSGATTTHLAAITQREVAVWKPFVVVLEATTGDTVAGTYPVLYGISRSSAEIIQIFRSGSNGYLKLGMHDLGVWGTTDIKYIADNTAFKIAVQVCSQFVAISVDGGATQYFTRARSGGVFTLESIGCLYNGAGQWNGSIQSCTLIHPAVWTDAQLEAA